MNRRIALPAAVAAVAVVIGACSPDEVTSPEPQVVEEIGYAPGLGVDLDSMTRTASGLYYQDLEVGEGPLVEAGDSVEVRFAGYLNTGQNFGAGPLEPFIVGLGQYIPGFEEALLGMREGGLRKAVIPPELGYGSQPNGQIPGGSVLIFDLLVERVVKGPFEPEPAS